MTAIRIAKMIEMPSAQYTRTSPSERVELTSRNAPRQSEAMVAIDKQTYESLIRFKETVLDIFELTKTLS